MRAERNLDYVADHTFGVEAATLGREGQPYVAVCSCGWGSHVASLERAFEDWGHHVRQVNQLSSRVKWAV